MKKYVLIILIAICIFASGGVVALTLYADDIIYNPSNSDFKVDNAQSALDELYNMIGSCNSGNESIILYFGGKEFLASDVIYGRTNCSGTNVSTASGPYIVLDTVDPKIFSSIRCQGNYWGKSATDTVTGIGIEDGKATLSLIDTITGKVVHSQNVYGRPFNSTIDLTSLNLKNPVKLQWQTTGHMSGWGDPTGEAYLK